MEKKAQKWDRSKSVYKKKKYEDTDKKRLDQELKEIKRIPGMH